MDLPHMVGSGDPQPHLRSTDHGLGVMLMTENRLVTRAGLKKMELELAKLDELERAEVTERIRAAREFGEGAESCEFLGARLDLERLDLRVAELRRLIPQCEVIEETPGGGEVRPGARVAVQCDGAVEEFQIVGSLEADPLHGRISYESPLGRTLLGRHIGDSVEWESPEGLHEARLLTIS